MWIGVARRVRLVRAQAGEVIGDRAVVLGSVSEHFLGQHELGVVADAAGTAIDCLHFSEHRAIVERIADHHDILVVLGCRAQHRRTADVDVFDRLFERAAVFCHGRLERVQIHDHHVDGRHVVLLQLRHVLGKVAPRQYAAVHFRMQRLHAAIEHFRKTGVVGHFGDRHAVIGQQFCGAAGRQQIDA